MEYIHYRGEFADVPLDEMRTTFDREYPGFLQAITGADFSADLVPETGK